MGGNRSVRAGGGAPTPQMASIVHANCHTPEPEMNTAVDRRDEGFPVVMAGRSIACLPPTLA